MISEYKESFSTSSSPNATSSKENTTNEWAMVTWNKAQDYHLYRSRSDKWHWGLYNCISYGTRSRRMQCWPWDVNWLVDIWVYVGKWPSYCWCVFLSQVVSREVNGSGRSWERLSRGKNELGWQKKWIMVGWPLVWFWLDHLIFAKGQKLVLGSAQAIAGPWLPSTFQPSWTKQYYWREGFHSACMSKRCSIRRHGSKRREAKDGSNTWHEYTWRLMLGV